MKEYLIKDDDKLSFKITKFNQSQGHARLIVKNDENAAVSLFVTLELESIPGYFSDNGFNLLPGESKEVVFKSKSQINREEFQITLRSYNQMLKYIKIN